MRSVFFNGAVTAVALAALPGCATLSESECRTADWFQIGKQDGRDGYKHTRLYDHRQACTRYGIYPPGETYYSGRQVGLALYCTPDNGFREGRSGRKYKDVCPAKYESAFVTEYRKGEMIHEVDEDIEAVESDIDFKQNRLEDEDTNDRQADELREDLRGLYRRRRHLDRELLRLERRYGRETRPSL